MKRNIKFLAAVLFLSLSPNTAVAESGTCGDSLTWTLDDEGTLTISGTGDMTDYTSIRNVPWYSNSSSIRSIVIENGVTSIGYYAFCVCDSVASATIGNGVTSIGDGAFYHCRSLVSVTIPNSVTSIGERAFYGCYSLTNVTIPDSVMNIRDSAFACCHRLARVTIGNSVTSIGDMAFEWCERLTDVYYEGSKKEWKSISIGWDNDNLTNAVIHYNGSTTVETVASGTSGDNLKWTLDSDGTLTISGTGNMEDYTNSIAPWYSNHSCIKSVVIENGVTRIGEYAFFGCRSLASVTIPNSVTSIGDSAFLFCRSLASVTIPDSVTSIGDYSFYGCRSLTNVTIPNSVTSIGDSAFLFCRSLASVTIPNSVTSIGDYSFVGCRSLTNVTIPDSVESIGNYAFSYCESLGKIEVDSNNKDYTSVDGVLFDKEKTTLVQYPVGNDRTTYKIPNSVTSVGNEAFASCTSLKKIEVDSNNKNYTSIDGVLFDKEKTTLVQYPVGNDRTTYKIPNSVTSIWDMAFYSCDSLASVTIPSGVTSIGDDAFYNCDSLASVTIPNSVTSIGDRAFDGCESLTDVYYEGSKKEWKSISIRENNRPLTNAAIHYNSVSENSQ